jgi:hydrophobe/amphiphile efflux-3 (HAE3) family protein
LVRSWLRRLVQVSLDHPRLALAIFAGCLVVSACGLQRLYLQTDGRSLFPEDHQALVFQRDTDHRFTTSNFLVVGISAPPGETIYSPAALSWLLDLTDQIEQLPGVAREEVRSLSTVFSPLWLDHGLYLEPPLRGRVRNAEEVQAVRRIAAADPLFVRVLVASDEGGVAIYVPLVEGADRRAVFHRVESLATEQQKRLPAKQGAGLAFHLLGPAAAESLLGEHVLADLALLLPLSLLVVALVFWFWYRQPSIVFVGLGEAASVVILSLGFMGWMSRGISLVTVIMPVILATYCVADTVHVAQRFQLKCAVQGRSRRAALEEALDEIMEPVVYTSGTTLAGFLAFAVSPIPPLRDFGLFSAIGIFLALLVSLLVVPAGLLLSGFGRRDLSPALPSRITRALAAAMSSSARFPAAFLLTAFLLSGLIGAGALRLRIQDSWVENFNPTNPLVRSERWFNERFMGTNVLNVLIDDSATGGALSPASLSSLAALQAELADHSVVGGSLSLADQEMAVGRTLEGSARLPRSPAESQEWALLLRMAGGTQNLAPYLDSSGNSSNLWIFLNRADYAKTREVLDAVGRFDWRGARPASVRFSGDAYLGYLLVDMIARSQRLSLLASLLVNLVVVWFMVRSVPAAVLAVLPVSLSILWNFGFMGWADVPLGIATSTFSAIALGIGVDYALHWIARLRLSLDSGSSWDEAMAQTAATTGGAILLNGLVLVFGFGLLVLSSVPPTARLGLLMVVNTLSCQLVTLLVLPAAATVLHRFVPRDRMLALIPRREVYS